MIAIIRAELVDRRTRGRPAGRNTESDIAVINRDARRWRRIDDAHQTRPVPEGAGVGVSIAVRVERVVRIDPGAPVGVVMFVMSDHVITIFRMSRLADQMVLQGTRG